IQRQDKRTHGSKYTCGRVERPRPAYRNRRMALEEPEPRGERHSHRESGGRDQQRRNHNPDAKRQADSGGKDRLQSERQSAHDCRGENQYQRESVPPFADKAAAPETAEPAPQKHREDNDGKGVRRVAKEQNEFLDQGDLDEDVSNSDCDEKQQESSSVMFGGQTASENDRGHHQDDGHRGDANQQSGKQYR